MVDRDKPSDKIMIVTASLYYTMTVTKFRNSERTTDQRNSTLALCHKFVRSNQSLLLKVPKELFSRTMHTPSLRVIPRKLFPLWTSNQVRADGQLNTCIT